MASATEIGIVRELAARYAEIAARDVQQERIRRYKESNARKRPRPILLIDEIPWGEMGHEDELRVRSRDPLCAEMEWHFRSWLFRWNHIQGDLVLPDNYPVSKLVTSTGIGLTVEERTILATTGSDIKSHQYTDQLENESDIEKLRLPTLTYDREGTERRAAAVQDILGGLLSVRITGLSYGTDPWDQIAELRGVSSLLYDLSDRAPYMHRIMEKMTAIHLHALRQMEELNLLEPHPIYLHCTPACTYDLPPSNFRTESVKAKDVWGRHAAQIFSAVSPAMHDEFDIAYARRLTGDCGLLYYGCCEPLDNKIGILRKMKNLRKISITPWADVDRAADSIGGDYVLSYKPNPAFVAVDHFDPEPVRKEISKVLAACKRNGTTCELILKDISSVHNHPQSLFEWERTAMDQISKEF
jgi:hypothetical protein